MNLGFGLTDWMLYTLWGVIGFMMLDFAIGLIRSFWKGSLSTSFIIDYLKDFLYIVFPLRIVLSLIPVDPTKWTLIVFYFISGLAVIVKYILDIKSKFK